MEPDEESAGFEYWKPVSPPQLASYDVLDAGSGEVLVPFLFAAAPTVDDVEVKASLATSSSTKTGLVIKILGNGFGGSAKVTLKSTREVTAAAGELVGLAATVPIVWELQAEPSNHDHTWVVIEVSDDGRRTTPIRTFTDRSLLKIGHAFADGQYDTRDGATKPLEVSEGRTVEGGASFSVGFKNEAAGIEATLDAELESSSEVVLSATLPIGHRYDVSWWQTPNGALVSQH